MLGTVYITANGMLTADLRLRFQERREDLKSKPGKGNAIHPTGSSESSPSVRRRQEGEEGAHLPCLLD